LPHASQKCAARMVPHDQQDCVSSGAGFAVIVVKTFVMASVKPYIERSPAA